MFHLLVAVLSIAIALLRGGSLTKIPDVQRLWLPPTAAVFQLMTRFFPGTLAAMVLMMCSYLLLIWFVACNWRYVGLRLLVVGLGLNFLVIGANGGRMPISPVALETAGIGESASSGLATDLESKHQLMRPDSLFAFLGDVIPVKYPIRQVMSVGDLFILVGAFLLVQEGLGKRIGLFGTGEP